jgi:hypothetical protein
VDWWSGVEEFGLGEGVAAGPDGVDDAPHFGVCGGRGWDGWRGRGGRVGKGGVFVGLLVMALKEGDAIVGRAAIVGSLFF